MIADDILYVFKYYGLRPRVLKANGNMDVHIKVRKSTIAYDFQGVYSPGNLKDNLILYISRKEYGDWYDIFIRQSNQLS